MASTGPFRRSLHVRIDEAVEEAVDSEKFEFARCLSHT